MNYSGHAAMGAQKQSRREIMANPRRVVALLLRQSPFVSQESLLWGRAVAACSKNWVVFLHLEIIFISSFTQRPEPNYGWSEPCS